MAEDHNEQIRKQYKLRPETIECIYAEFSKDWTPHQINRFIDVLAWLCPNTRSFPSPSNTELLLLELARMESVKDLTRQLVALMAYGPTTSADMLWDVLGDAGHENLNRANKEAEAWIDKHAFLRQGTGGQDVSASATFVACVAYWWRKCFRDLPPKPNGNFLRVCNALVTFESLPFKITPTAIKKGLKGDLF
ncbi:MAG: hypothetical protein ACKOWD_05265 [Rhodoferax sp.]